MVQIRTLQLVVPLLVAHVQAGLLGVEPFNTLLNSRYPREEMANATFLSKLIERGPSSEEREMEREARIQRQRERNARVKEALQGMRPENAEKVSIEELEAMGEDHPVIRNLAWGRGNGNNAIQYADPGEDYDMWQQAYRMLGGFIDCDHYKEQGGGSHDQEGGQNANKKGCSRWMMWAAVRFCFRPSGIISSFFSDATPAVAVTVR